MSSALERQVESLQRRLAEERKNHAKQINAKNKALERSRSELLFEISTSFPNLRTLMTELHRAHLYASPLKSPTNDGSANNEDPTPLDTGASTKIDRRRADEIDHRLKELAHKIRDWLGERGPLDEKGPQCWEPDCPARGWHQAFVAKACTTCGRPFGRHRPLKDLTSLRPKGRCWTRGCRLRGRTYRGSCPECGHTPTGWNRPNAANEHK